MRRGLIKNNRRNRNCSERRRNPDSREEIGKIEQCILKLRKLKYLINSLNQNLIGGDEVLYKE